MADDDRGSGSAGIAWLRELVALAVVALGALAAVATVAVVLGLLNDRTTTARMAGALIALPAGAFAALLLWLAATGLRAERRRRRARAIAWAVALVLALLGSDGSAPATWWAAAAATAALGWWVARRGAPAAGARWPRPPAGGFARHDRLVAAAGAGALLLALAGGGALTAAALAPDGHRVDVRDEADDCYGTDQPTLCGGSGDVVLAVDPSRRRVLVVWQGSYEVGRTDLYAREVDERGEPLGRPVRLARLDDRSWTGVEARSRAGGGWSVWWRGRRRDYDRSLRPLGDRRGRAIGSDPRVRGGRALLPGGVEVAVVEEDGEIRAREIAR